MAPDFSNCSLAFDDGSVNWDLFSSCLPLPLALSLLIVFSVFWLFFLIVVFFRYFKNRCSAAKNMVVGKKLQILQVWFYSYLFTIVYITSLFTAATLFKQGEVVSPILILCFTFLSTVLVTTIDVVGSESRKSGTNVLDFRVAFEYLLTLHLPKAVWKVAAHPEEGEAFDATNGFLVSNGAKKSKTGVLTKTFGLNELSNSITPQVYDVKDAVSIFCTFCSIPAIAILLFDYLISETIDISIDNFLLFSTILFFITSLLSVLLGDWERLTRGTKFSKIKLALYCLFYLFKRPIEFTARLTFYVIACAGTLGFAAFLLGIEFLFFWWSHISKFDSPLGGRVRGTFHKLYNCFSEIFFGCFRRISVDKNLVLASNDMSVAIELVRYIVKGICTAIGFLIFVTERTVFWDESKDWIIFVSLAANVILLVMLIIEFVVIKRSELKKKDVKDMFSEWNRICCWVFRPKVEYVDRTKPMAEGSFNLI